MVHFPHLTESDIRDRVGETSFERGRRYYRDGAILNPRRQGDTLKAQCRGSRPSPYQVKVTLGPAGILSAHCSCPVGAGGYCKHTAALLLTWLHKPEAFVEVEPLSTTLDRYTKDQLIELIVQFIERYPDLEMDLERFIMRQEAAHTPANPDAIRWHVRQAFGPGEYDEWAEPADIALNLEDVISVGDAYARQGRWWDAATVYRIIAKEILDHWNMIADEEGELRYIVSLCVNNLEDCLARLRDAAQRETILRALFDVHHWDTRHGGLGMGDDVPDIILAQATPEERRRVADWVGHALSAGDSWVRHVLGSFLLKLMENEIDDETFLRICRQTGQSEALVERLLSLNRVEEAANEARQVNDYTLLTLADILVKRGYAGLAESLVRERVPASQDTRLLVWLIKQAEARRDQNEVLSLTEALFWQRPSLDNYKALKNHAQPLSRWESIQADILSRLSESQNYALLTEIHLEEGDIDRALETLALANRHRRRQWGWEWSDPSLHLQVAAAAEESRPREAIRLYMAEVTRLISLQGRPNYATAAAHLCRVRDLYTRLNEPDAWKALIADLRQQHRRLRAFQDELTKAGL